MLEQGSCQYSMANIPNFMNRSPLSLEMMQGMDEFRLRGLGASFMISQRQCQRLLAFPFRCQYLVDPSSCFAVWQCSDDE